MRITGMNHAVLYVRDARRQAEWYQRVLDFQPVAADDLGRFAFLRAPLSDNHHDIAFFSVGAGAPGPTPGGVGLYHLAWEVPTLADLDDARQQLEAAGALVGASDHGVSMSLYAKDPDGLEFEVMWRVPADRWSDQEHEAVVRPLDIAATRRRFADLETPTPAVRAATPTSSANLSDSGS